MRGAPLLAMVSALGLAVEALQRDTTKALGKSTIPGVFVCLLSFQFEAFDKRFCMFFVLFFIFETWLDGFKFVV